MTNQMIDKVVTTKDFYIDHAENIFRSPYKHMDVKYKGWNTAVLIYNNNVFTCDRHTHYRRKVRDPNNLDKWKYIIEYCEADGYPHNGFYGYEYNVLELFYDFIKRLPDNTKIIAARNGETTARELWKAADVSTPLWNDSLRYKPVGFQDYTRVKMLRRLETLCKSKNVIVDLTPYYLGSVELVIHKIEERTDVRAFADVDKCKWITHTITYADGYTVTETTKNGISDYVTFKHEPLVFKEKTYELEPKIPDFNYLKINVED